jgi:metal-sulfur cluster biosynthetic enzyme
MTAEASEDLVEQIKNALCLVIDPELGYNIIDLGLVYDVALDADGVAHVTMTTTTRGCPATNYLAEGARDAAAAIADVEQVEVTLTYDPPWTPRMMTVQARQHLGIADERGW